ncbi:uncharacterized protein [Battus philenor]|uniref:uncharacterized protein n=1 Tax=Battus philenor TaxID=42288 RepID=UPI0035CF3448
MRVNYDRVCRLCLSSRGELLPIFPKTRSDNKEPPVLASKIRDCVSVEVTEDDYFPTNVCKKCHDNVNNWHIFKAVCERTQNKLQTLIKINGIQLEEVQIKSEPLSDDAYDDGVVVDASYADLKNASTSSKVQPEGPPILASLGLTRRNDNGMKSENKEKEDDEEMNNSSETFFHVPHMPEVSIKLTRPAGETLRDRQKIQQLASKDCLVCGRSYRYPHNAKRHELNSHSFDRHTDKISAKKIHNVYMQPKLRPNLESIDDPKARLMPSPISKKMQPIPKRLNAKPIRYPAVASSIPTPTKTPKVTQNNLPYPFRLKGLKDLQIKKKEPRILETLLTIKPEILVSEPDFIDTSPESPEKLISEPEIASFQLETMLYEQDDYDQPEDADIDYEMQNNQGHNYDTIDMETDTEIAITLRTKKGASVKGDGENEGEEVNEMVNIEDDDKNNPEINEKKIDLITDTTNSRDEKHIVDNNDAREDGETKESVEWKQEKDDEEQLVYNHEDDDLPPIAPIVEVNVDMHNSYYNEMNEEENLDESVDLNETEDDVKKPDKLFVTKTQRDFILKYRDIIEQLNTKRCLCCQREHTRRKALIQHLQKNGQKVPKHTCYNCLITFGHIGALLSHMWSKTCTDLWKIIYNKDGITDDLVLEDEP